MQRPPRTTTGVSSRYHVAGLGEDESREAEEGRKLHEEWEVLGLVRNHGVCGGVMAAAAVWWWCQ